MILTGLGKPRKDQTNDEDSRVVISAITSEAGLDEKEFMKHVGGTKNGKQHRIIKFTTHSLKENVFLKQNQNKKNEIEKRKKNSTQKSLIQLNV